MKIEITKEDLDLLCYACLRKTYYLISDPNLTVKVMEYKINRCQKRMKVNEFIIPCENCITLSMCKATTSPLIKLDNCSITIDNLNCLFKLRILCQYLRYGNADIKIPQKK